MSSLRGSNYTVFATVVVLAFLHFALRPVIDPWIARPNLLVCAVLVAALKLRPGAAAGVGFALGLLEDAMAVTNFGMSALLLVLMGYLGSRTREQFVGEEPLFMGTYMFIGTWLYQAAAYLMLGAGSDALSYLLVQSPLDALATSAVGYVALLLVRGR